MDLAYHAFLIAGQVLFREALSPLVYHSFNNPVSQPVNGAGNAIRLFKHLTGAVQIDERLGSCTRPAEDALIVITGYVHFLAAPI